LPDRPIETTLFSEDEIGRRVEALGSEINRDYHGEDVVLVGILKGALIFLADLLRNIALPVELDFMCIETYASGKTPAGRSSVLYPGKGPFRGRNVIVVEDIVDTGLTLRYIMQAIRKEQPNTLEVCALLMKKGVAESDITVKYVGFTIPRVFVIGYGMDYCGRHRELPYIGVMSDIMDASEAGTSG